MVRATLDSNEAGSLRAIVKINGVRNVLVLDTIMVACCEKALNTLKKIRKDPAAKRMLSERAVRSDFNNAPNRQMIE